MLAVFLLVKIFVQGCQSEAKLLYFIFNIKKMYYTDYHIMKFGIVCGTTQWWHWEILQSALGNTRNTLNVFRECSLQRTQEALIMLMSSHLPVLALFSFSITRHFKDRSMRCWLRGTEQFVHTSRSILFFTACVISTGCEGAIKDTIFNEPFRETDV